MKENILTIGFWVIVLCTIFWVFGGEDLQAIGGVGFALVFFFVFLFSVVWVIKKAWKS